jgi:hypothetical protein
METQARYENYRASAEKLIGLAAALSGLFTSCRTLLISELASVVESPKKIKS